jgi:hypothetical protein
VSPVKRYSSGPSTKPNEQLAALKPALVHFALFLLDQGITAGELQSAISEVYVKAAASRARMKNGRVNQSRVAAMTGFTRTEVRRLVDSNRSAVTNREIFGARRVLDGWSCDPEFKTRNGRPAKLPLRGGYGSFTSLARRYSADIPPKAILDELRRLKAVDLSKGFAAQRPPTASDRRRRSQNISRAAFQLTNIFQAIGYPDAVAPTLVFSGDVMLDTSGNTLSRMIKERVEQNAKAFLGGLESAASVFIGKQKASVRRRANRLLVRVSVTNLSPGK